MKRLADHGLTAAMAVLAVYFVSVSPLAPAAVIRASLSYVLLDWLLAAAILLAVYAITSLEDIQPLLRAALLSSVPAMWFVPATLLISTRSPWLVLTGLLLVGNSVRVLIRRGFSRRSYLPVARRSNRPRTTTRMFSYSIASPALQSDTTLIMLGALALQLGIWTGLEGFSLIAASFVGGTGTAWTLAAIFRRIWLPSQRVDSITRAAITLVLAVAISMTQVGVNTQSIGTLTLPQITSLTLNQLIHPSAQFHASPKKIVTRLFKPANVQPVAERMVVDGVEGVILRPQPVKASRRIIVATKNHSPFHLAPSKLLFTGEYRLFPVSSSGLKKNWSVQTGTLVDSVYATVTGSPLQTEAYQVLDSPFNLDECRTLSVTLVSHESFPAAASVQLTGDGKALDLGPEIFGLDQLPEETLEFALPESSGEWRVTAIRIIFRCIESECSQSLRIAIKGFNFMPRS